MCKNMNSFVSFKICDKDFSVSLIFSVKLTSVPLSTVPYKKLIACFTGCQPELQCHPGLICGKELLRMNTTKPCLCKMACSLLGLEGGNPLTHQETLLLENRIVLVTFMGK